MDSRTIFDLNAKLAGGDLRQQAHAAEPPADDPAPPGPAGVFAIRPPADAGSLGQAGANLAGANVKPPRSFHRRQIGIKPAGNGEFFPRKWRQSDSRHEGLFLIPQHTEKIAYLPVQIVVGLNGRGGTIQQNRCGTRKWLAIMVAGRQQQ